MKFVPCWSNVTQNFRYFRIGNRSFNLRRWFKLNILRNIHYTFMNPWTLECLITLIRWFSNSFYYCCYVKRHNTKQSNLKVCRHQYWLTVWFILMIPQVTKSEFSFQFSPKINQNVCHTAVWTRFFFCTFPGCWTSTIRIFNENLTFN